MARNRRKARTGYAGGGAVDNQYANVDPRDADTVKPGTAAEWTPETYQASLRQQQAQGYAQGGAVRQNFRRGGSAHIPTDPEAKAAAGWGLSADEDRALRLRRQAQDQEQSGLSGVSDDALNYWAPEKGIYGAIAHGTNASISGMPDDQGNFRRTTALPTGGSSPEGYAGGGAVRRIGYADGGTVYDDPSGAAPQPDYSNQVEQRRLADERTRAEGAAREQTEAERQQAATARQQAVAEQVRQRQGERPDSQAQPQAQPQAPAGAPETPWYRQVYDKLVDSLKQGAGESPLSVTGYSDPRREAARPGLGGAVDQFAGGFRREWNQPGGDPRFNVTGVDTENKPRNYASEFMGEGRNPYAGDTLVEQAKGKIHNFLWGEGSHTVDELDKMQAEHPTKDLNKALQDAWTKAELAGDHEAGAKVMQTARKAYELPRGYSAAAFDKGDPDNGLVAWQRGFNQIPNNQRMDIAKAPANDGRYMVKLTPEKAGQGEAKEYWMSPTELRKVQEAATFDNVLQHGLPAIIDSVTGKTRPLDLPEPGATVAIGPDGRPVTRATYDMTGMVRPGAPTEDRGFTGLKSITDAGGRDLVGQHEQQASSSSKTGSSQSSSSEQRYQVRPPSYFENPAAAAAANELPRPRGNVPAGFPVPAGAQEQAIGPQVPPGFTPPAPQRDVFETLRTPGGLQRPQEYNREEAIRYNAALAEQQNQFRSPRAGDTAYEARNRQLDQKSGYAAAQDAARAAERQQAVTGRAAEVARTNEINRRIQAGEPVGLGHSEQSRPDIPLPPRQTPTPESMVEAKRARSWVGQPYTAAEQAVDLKQARELELIRGRGEAPVAVAGIKTEGANQRARGRDETKRWGIETTEAGKTARADVVHQDRQANLTFLDKKLTQELISKGTPEQKQVMQTYRTKLAQGQTPTEDEEVVYQSLKDHAKDQGISTPGAAAPAAAPAAGVVQVASLAEVEKLPSGTEFIGPDGIRRRKP